MKRMPCWMTHKRSWIDNREWWLASLYRSAGHCRAADRLIRRKAIIAAAIATHPYSSSITQPGSDPHGRPSARKCHWKYVGIMLTVQMMISSVEADIRNGSSQRRYHGNTTGAHKRDAAIGQANRSGDHSGAALLSQVAVTNPTSTASPASNCGGATRSSVANTGPLKRKLCTYVPSEPIGMRP